MRSGVRRIHFYKITNLIHIGYQMKGKLPKNPRKLSCILLVNYLGSEEIY